MSTCSVATALLAVMAIVHFAITVVLSVLVVWVRCYCKKRDRRVVSSKDLSPQPTTTREEHEAFCRRVGQVEPPNLQEKETLSQDLPEKALLTQSLPLPPSDSDRNSVVFDNQGVSETWEEKEEEKPEMKNKTIEELRRNSASSIRKPSSPFRRISSPLTRSGRFSMTSFFGRKSVDMDAEAINLMTPTSITSPTEGDGLRSTSSSDGLESPVHILQHQEGQGEDNSPEHRGTPPPPVPTIIILATTDESQC